MGKKKEELPLKCPSYWVVQGGKEQSDSDIVKQGINPKDET
jgi:hypothetical protein